MNIMGMGWQEMMVILIGALLIFGPNRLPEVAGQLGKFVRDIRRMTADLSGELERTAGVGDIKKAVQSELAGVKSTVDAATKGVASSASSAASSVNRAVATASAAAKGSTSTAKPVTSATPASPPKPAAAKAGATTIPAKPVATKRDPLADVSFFEDSAPATSSTNQRGETSSGRTSQPGASTGSNGHQPASTAGTDLDALARARQRRLAAGYNRRAV